MRHHFLIIAMAMGFGFIAIPKCALATCPPYLGDTVISDTDWGDYTGGQSIAGSKNSQSTYLISTSGYNDGEPVQVLLYDSSDHTLEDSDTANDYQTYPWVPEVTGLSSAGSYRWVSTWNGIQSQEYEVYQRRFTSSLTPYGDYESYVFNDLDWEELPRIAALPTTGRYAVVATATPTSSPTRPYLRIFYSSGSTVTGNIGVDSWPAPEDQTNVTVSVASFWTSQYGDVIVVAWSAAEDSNEYSSVYFKVFNSSGTVVAATREIPRDTEHEDDWYPRVAGNSGGIVVTWQRDVRDSGCPQIVYQTWPVTGSTPYSTQNKVHSNPNYCQFKPNIAIGSWAEEGQRPATYYAITWSGDYGEVGYIYPFFNLIKNIVSPSSVTGYQFLSFYYQELYDTITLNVGVDLFTGCEDDIKVGVTFYSDYSGVEGVHRRFVPVTPGGEKATGGFNFNMPEPEATVNDGTVVAPLMLIYDHKEPDLEFPPAGNAIESN